MHTGKPYFKHRGTSFGVLNRKKKKKRNEYAIVRKLYYTRMEKKYDRLELMF